VERCEQLGIAYLVLHPGSHVGSGEAAGLRRVARTLDQVHRETRGCRTRMLLENTAGQGSSLGWRFEHLAAILDRVAAPERLGVCLDTCHAFTAGYDLRTAPAYRATRDRFAEILGLDRVMAFHLNDAKRDLGSRVDRHEQIGRGFLGLEAFRLLLNDRRFRGRPMVLETEKRDGEFLDEQNLALLRALVGVRKAPNPRQAAAIRRRARSAAARSSGKKS
jgi:deoxyribonuclease-4